MEHIYCAQYFPNTLGILYAFFWVILQHLKYKIQTPGNYPEESIQHSEHGESLKSRTLWILYDQFPLFTDSLE